MGVVASSLFEKPREASRSREKVPRAAPPAPPHSRVQSSDARRVPSPAADCLSRATDLPTDQMLQRTGRPVSEQPASTVDASRPAPGTVEEHPAGLCRVCSQTWLSACGSRWRRPSGPGGLSRSGTSGPAAAAGHACKPCRAHLIRRAVLLPPALTGCSHGPRLPMRRAELLICRPAGRAVSACVAGGDGGFLARRFVSAWTDPRVPSRTAAQGRAQRQRNVQDTPATDPAERR